MRRPLTIAVFAALLAVVFATATTPANADDADRACLEKDEQTGVCKAWASGTTPSKSPPSNSKNVKPPPPKCHDTTRKEVPCRTKDGYWSNTYHCYVKAYSGPDTKKLTAQLDVADDQMLATCTKSAGDTTERQQVIVIPKGEVQPPPDPRAIAWQLIAQINIQAGQIGLVPDSDHAMVGLPTWMWIDNPGPHTTGPVSRSTSVRGHTITIEAHLSQVTYTMGDGSTVTCAGDNAAGTRYLERFGTKPSPTCGHSYDRPGDYTVTARSVWTVNWHGVGQAGTLTIDVQRSLDLSVLEGHAVTR